MKRRIMLYAVITIVIAVVMMFWIRSNKIPRDQRRLHELVQDSKVMLNDSLRWEAIDVYIRDSLKTQLEGFHGSVERMSSDSGYVEIITVDKMLEYYLIVDSIKQPLLYIKARAALGKPALFSAIYLFNVSSETRRRRLFCGLEDIEAD
jgi:hypothetical protein